jgi:4-hydroxy-tetrahydrodipicolinate reductase
MSAIRVLLVGANGRMGKAVTAAVARDTSLVIVEGLGRGDSIAPAIENCEVVIDFSTAEATEVVCQACANSRKPLVLGTTGQTAAQKDCVTEAALVVPIVFAANFSVGVNVLFALTRRAAKLLGKDFDLDVVEMHHRTKKDAPSGTAKRLLEILREGRDGEGVIEAQSIRAGDIVGEHTVIMAGAGERLELTHRATSRENFALGALRAARWAITQPPGLYRMENVLGL